MREIKFRAWDTGRQRFCNAGNLHIEVSSSGTLCWSFGNNPCEPMFGEERDNFKLMQYTGLKDKNGVEIYEGDIVKAASFGGTYRVKYERAAFHPREVIVNTCTVIGNIYENPELLNAN